MTTRFLQRPRRLPGYRRPGRGAGQPEGRDDGDHFRFRRGGAGAADMSRFKFVGKRLPGSWPFSDHRGTSLTAARGPGLELSGFLKWERALSGRGSGEVSGYR